MRARVTGTGGDMTLRLGFTWDEYGSVRERFVHRSDKSRRSKMGDSCVRGYRRT
jgi:hypothetical protein